MARTKHPPDTNRLLDELPNGGRHRVIAACERVELVAGEVLAQSGKPIDSVYFPIACSISLITDVGFGPRLEVALVGSEGMVGVSLVLGVEVSSFHALVQGPGSAWRMSTSRFRRMLVAENALHQALKRYALVRMIQLGQTAGCTRFHVVEERLARWLLMTADRARSESFHMTHEGLAHTMGVRRVGVTRAASSLQKQKLIRYTRGDIAILDRKGLELVSCGCYSADLSTYSRILG